MHYATVSAVKRTWLSKKVHIRGDERGILWRDGDCEKLLYPGDHSFFDFANKIDITVHDRSRPWLDEEYKETLVRSKLLDAEIETLDLLDHQRAVVKIDGRFADILGPGRHAWWKGVVAVEARVIDIRENGGAIDAAAFPEIFTASHAAHHFHLVDVVAETQVAFFRNGKFVELLQPGRHAFWRGPDNCGFRPVDVREQSLDIGGQELLTADKLTIRLNAVLSYRVTDAVKSLLAAADTAQALYREAQLALRAAIGGRDLDTLLGDKASLVEELEKELRAKAAAYGISVTSFGVRDIILPGDIRELLLKATEARKASEAATIVRREETAAIRHQLNTARMLAENPVLLRLRELEAVEKVAATSKLKVVLGDKGLAEKVADMM